MGLIHKRLGNNKGLVVDHEKQEIILVQFDETDEIEATLSFAFTEMVGVLAVIGDVFAP